jgi:3-oxoacyl-[acyl-carrier-protein] synthase-1
VSFENREVVITGMGIVSCLGIGADACARSLREGRSGIALDPERKALGFRSSLTGKIVGFDPEKVLSRKARKTMPEVGVWAYAASEEARQMAGLSPDDLRGPGAGVIVGNDSAAAATVEGIDKTRADKTTRLLGSGLVFQSMTSSVSMNLSTLYGAQGASWTLAAACSSGAHSVGQAALLVATGLQDVVLAGGAQEINFAAFATFDAINAFSVREDDPERTPRPFDRSRDGLVPSGGAAMLVVESLERARRRGARVLARVASYAFSCDGDHISLANGKGALRCMEEALGRARLGAGEIEYVNAHATGTLQGDAVEARALATLFGGRGVPVSSTKSMSGHECWMAGASELVYSILMMRDGFIAPTRNLEDPDEACQGLLLPREALPRRPRSVLSNSFGFGGTNAAIVLVADESSR